MLSLNALRPDSVPLAFVSGGPRHRAVVYVTPQMDRPGLHAEPPPKKKKKQERPQDPASESEEEEKEYAHRGHTREPVPATKPVPVEPEEEPEEEGSESEEDDEPNLPKSPLQKPVVYGDRIKLLHDEHLVIEPVHAPDQRDTLYITGASGAGKSTTARLFAARYRALWPERDILLFSTVESNSKKETLRTNVAPLYIKRFNLETLADDPEATKDLVAKLHHTLCIFDDVEGVEKNILDRLQKLMDLIGTTGRHTVTSMIYIRHTTTNYKETRTQLQECKWMVVYPSGRDRAITYLLDKYGGLDKAQIADVFNLKSRWVALYNRYPAPVIVYDGGAHLTTAPPASGEPMERASAAGPKKRLATSGKQPPNPPPSSHSPHTTLRRTYPHHSTRF